MQSAPHRGINKTTLRPDVAIRQQAQGCKQPRVSGAVCDQRMTLPPLVSLHFSCFCTSVYTLGNNWVSLGFDPCSVRVKIQKADVKLRFLTRCMTRFCMLTSSQ